MKKPFYITTPIYYVTDAPHIGHLYSTVACDILARYHRLQGDEVLFLTGTDEHGQKVQKKAKEAGETPIQLADRVVTRYVDTWKKYGITYDDFIRTTEPRHAKVVVEYLQRLMKTGDVYLGSYEGWYCVPDETYWTETQLVDGKCPDCGRVVERLQEESYFFRMSAYQDRLVEHIKNNPDFIVPTSRRNEVLGFIQQGLRDISISRTTIEWGIPMPADPKAARKHYVYVWFDALTNYLSALGPLDGDPKYKTFWGSAVHLVGKDILRFHAVYWPTYLMALGLPLPKQIVAHGWLTNSNRKISKSLGNSIDPMALADEVGIDGMRFFLFREFVFGLDGEYSPESMYTRINADLANDYGNCVSRVCSMIVKYLGNQVERADVLKRTSPISEIVAAKIPEYHAALSGYHFEKALEAAWAIVGQANRFIENEAPWALAKAGDDASKERLQTALIHCHEGLRIASTLALPFIPTSAAKALATLGCAVAPTGKLAEHLQWGKTDASVLIQKPTPLFPRLEFKSEG